ncbi:hypothetical protein SCP_1303420 [Sparassis crispa]|uniref:Uncharacterized protein n=1 Tax=Sparassis crispa TaxID=139825 RepID=A0A401H249_9APHY|nr:hypothetical protein SCP_1303420 [Sparassis crispa]GBE88526.1 hypothetical protein SCP_1303420 [Sparassis crispa]
MSRHQSFLHFTLILLSCSPSGLTAPVVSLASSLVSREMSLEPPTVILSVNSNSDVTSSSTPAATGAAVVPSVVSASLSATLSATDIDFAEASPTWTITTESILTITDVSGTASPTPDPSTTPVALDVVAMASESASTSAQVDLVDISTAMPTPTQALSLTLTPTPETSSFTPTTLYLPATSVPPLSQDVVSSSSASLSAAISGTSYAQFSGVKYLSSGLSGPTAITNPNPSSAAQGTSSQQARKSALVAAFVTLGSLTALGVCILCLRCKIVSRVRRLRRESNRPSSVLTIEDGFQPKSILINREKDSLIPGPAPQAVTLQPFSPSTTCSDGPPTPRPLDWALFAMNNEGPFEDVTHVLSTSAPRDGAVSRLSEASTTTRTSGGASLAAESYMTCESRYSSPSVERRSQDSTAAARGSGESMALSFAFPSQSLPPSEPLRAPEASTGALAVLPAVNLVGQKALHVPSLAPSEELVLAGSEWDVADAYGARSSGASSVLNEPEEHMETVEIGGRLCVLVQGI